MVYTIGFPLNRTKKHSDTALFCSWSYQLLTTCVGHQFEQAMIRLFAHCKCILITLDKHLKFASRTKQGLRLNYMITITQIWLLPLVSQASNVIGCTPISFLCLNHCKIKPVSAWHSRIKYEIWNKSWNMHCTKWAVLHRLSPFLGYSLNAGYFISGSHKNFNVAHTTMSIQ